MKKLTRQQVIILHEILIKFSGGAGGVRDVGLRLADGSLKEKALLDFIIEHS